MMTKYLVLFTIGTVIGSFCQVIAIRGLRAATLTTEPSHCDYCGNRLAWFELVPLISYLVLQGKCRHCRNKIPIAGLCAEVAGGCVALYYREPSTDLLLLLIGFLLLIMSLCDWRELLVPSYLLAITAFTTIIFLMVNKQFTPSYLIVVIVWVFYQRWPVFSKWLGAADLDLILLYAVLAGPALACQALLISSGLAMLAFKVWQHHQLPFVPCLAVGYLWILWCLV